MFLSKFGAFQLTYETPFVGITTIGSTFAPVLELATGSTATVSWSVEGGDTYYGIAPNINFGTVATRNIRMRVLNGAVNALNEVKTFNVGYDNSNDSGDYMVGASYNLSAQNVTNIENVNCMTGLVNFLAASNINLTCAIDFSGMSNLEHIEAWGSKLSGVTLTGCTSLIRLCIENNNVSKIDLNPIAASVYDLRMSGNPSPFTLTTLTAPLAKCYHYCCQGQTVINHPTSSQLPVVRELWDWSSGQTGTLIIRSTAINSVQTYSNNWTAIDVANQFPSNRFCSLDAHSCSQLTSINITGCPGLLQVDLHDCNFNTVAVDSILETINSFNTLNGTLNLSGNGVPTSNTDVNALRSRGWTVTVGGSAVSVTSVSVAPDMTEVIVGSTQQLTATITPENATDKTVTWSSSDETIATVSSSGLVTAVAAGAAIITATTTDGSYTDTCAVTISVTSATLWTDNFDRADATGLTNVGNGWVTWLGGADADIVSNQLVQTGNLFNYGAIVNPATGSLPADYTITAYKPAIARTNYLGIVARQANNTGVRLIFAEDYTSMTLGSAEDWATNNIAPNGSITFPANWTNDAIPHTYAMRMEGSTITVILDGEVAAEYTCTVNSEALNTSVGFCGQATGKYWDKIEVTNNTV